MNQLLEQAVAQSKLLVDQAMDIWRDGGWAMGAIAAVSLLMFALAVHIYLRLRSLGFKSVSEKTWRRWIDHPEQCRGPVGEVIQHVATSSSTDEVSARLDEVIKTRHAPIRRDLRLMKVFVSAAPLLGLLGTVIGMLTTFGALASSGGGDETQGQIAAGISEALITTETGLIIALPGLFIHSLLSRQHEAYRAFLAKVESVCSQRVYRRQRAAGG